VKRGFTLRCRLPDARADQETGTPIDDPLVSAAGGQAGLGARGGIRLGTA
jgi:hypothetical protein